MSQHGTRWSFPKGGRELGETPLETARREIAEETGLTCLEFPKELGTYDRYRMALDGSDDFTERKRITLFLFTTNEETLRPRDLDNPEARWGEREKAVGLLTHRKEKEFFLKILPELS